VKQSTGTARPEPSDWSNPPEDSPASVSGQGESTDTHAEFSDDRSDKTYLSGDSRHPRVQQDPANTQGEEPSSALKDLAAGFGMDTDAAIDSSKTQNPRLSVSFIDLLDEDGIEGISEYESRDVERTQSAPELLNPLAANKGPEVPNALRSDERAPLAATQHSVGSQRTLVGDDGIELTKDEAFDANKTIPMTEVDAPEPAQPAVKSTPASDRGKVKRRTGRRLEESLLIRKVRIKDRVEPAQQPSAGSGDQVGDSDEEFDYAISLKIGEGGMGIVYRTRQASLERDVVLKKIKPRQLDEGSQTSPSAHVSRVQQNLHQKEREWFLSEAVVTANLEHPYIVPIYDIVKDEKKSLFYAMKWVQGTAWDQLLRETGKTDKSEEENLEILMKVADAIAFAHDKGIIHRDLKPENVMVGAHGEVYVMDWGAAMVTPQFERSEKVSQASSGFGTPAYAAPELILGTVDQIDARSDVYLLGAVLFEIVTGLPPHPGMTNRSQMMRILGSNIIRETDVGGVPFKPGELLDIARKAMATDPRLRYQTVQEFQHAIREYQKHDNSRLLSKRAGETLAKAQQSEDYGDYQRAVFAYDEAHALWSSNEEARAGSSRAKLAYANAALKKGGYDLGLEVADENDPSHGEVIVQLRKAQAERESQKRRLQRTRRAVAGLAAMIIIVLGVATYLINQQRAAAVYARAEEEKAKVAAQKSEREAIDAKAEEEKAKIAALESAKAEKKAKEDAVEKEREAVAAEKRAVAAKELADKARAEEELAKKAALNAQKLEELAKNEAIASEKKAKAAKAAQEYETYVAQIGLADSKIKTAAFDEVRRVLEEILKDEAKRKEEYLKDEQQRKPGAEKVAPFASFRGWEFDRLTYLSNQAEILLKGGQAVGAGDQRIEALAVDPTGSRYVAGRSDGTAVIGSTTDAKAPLITLPVGRPVLAVDFSRTGDLIATARESENEGSLQLWTADGKPVGSPFGGNGKAVYSVQFANRGGQTVLLTGGADGSAQIWSLGSGEPRPAGPPLKGHFFGAVRRALFSPDGKLIVTVGDDKRVVVWDDSGSKTEPQFSVKASADSYHTRPVLAAAWSAQGDRFVSADEGGHLLVWNPSALPAVQAKDSQEARRKAARSAVLFDNLFQHDNAIRSVAFSADGNVVLSSGDDHTVKLQRLRATGDIGRIEDSVITFRGHGEPVPACLLVAVDNNHAKQEHAQKIPNLSREFVLSGGHDSTVMRWDVATYKEEIVTNDPVLAGKMRPDRDVLSAAFSPDGSNVMTGNRDHNAYQWAIRGGRQSEINYSPASQKLDEGHVLPISTAAYAPDGKWFITAGMDNTSLLWDTATGTQWARLPETGVPAVVAISPDGKWLVTSASELANAKGKNDPSPRVKFWRVNRAVGKIDMARRAEKVQTVEFQSGRPSQLTTLAFAPGPDLLLFSGFDCSDSANRSGGGLVWKLKTDDDGEHWDVVGTVRASTQINSAVFVDDGRQLVTAGEDGSVFIHDLATETSKPRQLKKHDNPVRFVGLHRDGKSVWTVSAVKPQRSNLSSTKKEQPNEHLFRSWDLETAQEIENQRISIKTPNVFSVALAPQADEAVVVAADPSVTGRTVVRRFNLDTGEEVTRAGGAPYLATNKLDPRQFWGAIYAPQAVGGRSILALHDTRAERYDDKAKLEARSNPHGFVRTVAYSHDKRYLVTAGTDNTLKVWDVQVKPARAVCKIADPHGKSPSSVHAASLSPVKADGGYQILSAGSDGYARLWSWDGKADEPTEVRPWKHDSAVRSAAFSHDGRRIACGCEDGTAWVWKIDDNQQPLGKTVKAIPDKPKNGGHGRAVLAVAFSNKTADWIVTCGDDNLAFVWKVANNIQLHSILKGHAAAVRCAAFSPDDQRIITGSSDTYAKLWDPRLPGGAGAPANQDDPNARELLTLSRHERAVTAVAFSPENGETVMTASSDGETVLWLSTKPKEQPQPAAAAQAGVAVRAGSRR
jgi:WD40 repeat protein/serine/threonine protein kinase